MKCSIFLILQLFAIFQSVKSLATDCTYENSTSHVEYICANEIRGSFTRRNVNYLYCSNYPTGIIRGNVRVITFRGCKYSQLLVSSGLYQFENLRILNVSTVGIDNLYSRTFASNNHLENFIASHNYIRSIPATLFIHTPELMEIDLSYNKIEQLAPETFEKTPKLKTIQIGHNEIKKLPSQLFMNLVDLETLDVSYNHLYSFENAQFVSNKKLRSLNLFHNSLMSLGCGVLSALKSHSLKISLSTTLDLQTSCVEENMQIKSNVKISSNDSTSSALTITNGQFEWVFNKTDFGGILHLNFSNSDMQNIPALLDEASTLLTTLDLSNTFVGALSEKTFQKFTNLQYLYLSRTNLSNFQYATFYHQTNLRVLDLSYNDLNSVDFHLFVRNFRYLESLNLIGNNLTEIDSITRAHFPKLSTLAISKNRFTCEYLAKFLLQWQDLKLIHNNPSANQTHIGGVDCIHENHAAEKTTEKANNDNKTVARNNHSSELHAIKILLIILITILSIVCLYLFFTYDKCRRVRKMYKIRKIPENATENILYMNQEHDAIYHEADNKVYNELTIKVN